MARLEFKRGAFRELRFDPAIRRDINRRAKAIADKANNDSDLDNGYRVGSRAGARRPQGRPRATVVTATGDAVRDSAKNDRLLRSLNAGRS